MPFHLLCAFVGLHDTQLVGLVVGDDSVPPGTQRRGEAGWEAAGDIRPVSNHETRGVSALDKRTVDSERVARNVMARLRERDSEDEEWEVRLGQAVVGCHDGEVSFPAE